MDVTQYLDVFVEETREHLSALNTNLLQLEQDPGNVELVREILRSAHTLKGMAASMGFEQMARLTHALEDGLEPVKTGQRPVTSEFMDVLFACLDRLEAQLAAIVETGRDADISVDDVVDRLSAVLQADNDSAARTSALPVAERTEPMEGAARKYQVDIRFAPGCEMPAVRAYMVLQAYANLGEVVSSQPSAEEVRNGQCEHQLQLVLATTADPDTIREQALQISEVSAVDVSPVDGVRPPSAHEAMHPGQAEGHGTTGHSHSDGERKFKRSRTIRVDIERLETLMNLMSEFVIDRTRLEELARTRKDPELNETIRHLSRVSTELQDIVMKIRMVPVETVFQRFPRMVRDLAKALGKQVELQMEGGDTELDRTVADEIADPLVHILRNALDHGLESPAERLAVGKSATGVVRLSAYQAGNHVYIEIHDDGRGVDASKVIRKAVERGFVHADEASKLTEAQVIELLFHPGFSTADKVSDISGRGVGLDAVRAKIQSLGGDVVVRSRLGQGTTFVIELPLTLSILPAMMVTVADERYAIPLYSIVQMLRIPAEELVRAHGQQSIRYGERVLPLIDLGAWFWNRPTVDKAYVYVVLLRKGEKMAAVAVDEFLGQHDIVLKGLGGFFARPVPGIAGATITGDGRVALVLDPNVLMR